MNNQELKESYTVEVTQDIIDSAELDSVYNCIGAKTLYKAINIEDLDVIWGRVDGYLYIKEDGLGQYVSINEVGEFVDMMEIKEPCTVIFKRTD